MIRRSAFAFTDPAVYHDLFEPEGGTARPTLVMVHGGAHSGACYLHTADGRPGWAPFFAGRGWRVAVPDWPGTGRSGAVAPDRLTGEVVCKALGALVETLAPVVLMTHSMSGAYGWQLVERHGSAIVALVAVAPAPPGNVQAEAEVVARTETYVDIRRGGGVRRVPLREARLPDPDFVDSKLIGPGSTRFPRRCLDSYAASLLPLPPRLMYERQNIAGSQLRIADTAPFAGKPVLVVTGSDDVDHDRETDGVVADWLSSIGARVTFHFLPDLGITGNGHMLMLEENSDAIAALIVEWFVEVLPYTHEAGETRVRK